VARLELVARIATYELAYRMQSAAPDAVRIFPPKPPNESLYGSMTSTRGFGARCLLARRLPRRVFPFSCSCIPATVTGGVWGAATRTSTRITRPGVAKTQPVAGLLADLKRRGCFDETLVVWGGEFWPMPFEQGKGRDTTPTVHDVMAGARESRAHRSRRQPMPSGSRAE